MATGIRPTTYVDLDGVMIGPTVSPFGAKVVEYTDLTPEQVVAYVARYGEKSLNKPEEALKIVAAAEKAAAKEAEAAAKEAEAEAKAAEEAAKKEALNAGK